MAVRHVRTAFLQEQRRQRDRGDAHRHVDEEDPGPAQVRREQAAEQDPCGRAAPGCRTVDPERDIPFAALREPRHQE